MIYMDNSATSSPKPDLVIERVKKSLEENFANAGRSSHTASLKSARALYTARETVSRFINTLPENVVFTYNATYALNMAIHGSVFEGARVFTTPFEHNSILRPLWYLERQKGIKVYMPDLFTKDTNGMVEEFKKVVKTSEKPDFLIMTHTSNVTGRKMPVRELGEICRQYHIYFILDASQGLGTGRVDMQKDFVDVLCSSGHKGLFGINGSGFLAVSGESDIKISPIIQGGTGTLSHERWMPQFFPERLEAGTVGIIGAESIGAGIEYIEKMTPEILEKKTRSIREYLSQGIAEIPSLDLLNGQDNSTSIVLFNHKTAQSHVVASFLDEHDIACRAGLHCSPMAHEVLGTEKSGGAVRLSVSHFNTIDECDEVIRVLKSFI